MTSRRHYSLFLILGISLFLSLIYCPPYDVGISDKGIFTYTGWAVYNGLVPYRDFFDHKPPVIYFIDALGILLGGSWGMWVVNAGLALLATAVFFKCCRRYRLPYPWLLPLLFNLMIRDHLISEGIGMTREYTAFFQLIFFCVLAGRWRYRHFLLGFIGGLIFFTQQDQALAVLPFVVYVLLSKEEITAGKRILFIGAGFLAIFIPILVYFACHRSLAVFWDDAILFNLKVYTTEKKSLGDHFRTIKRVLDAGNYEIPFIAALCMGVTALAGKSRNKGLILAAFAGLLLTLSPEMMGGRFKDGTAPVDIVYYFLPLSAGVCLLVFTVFAFSPRTAPGSRAVRLAYGVLLCASLVYTDLQYATHLRRYDRDPAVSSPEMNYLRQHPPGNYQLYVVQNEDYIFAYYEFKILAPSRWVYQHLWGWYGSWDPDGQILHSIGQDLLRHHTTYVIMDPVNVASFRQPANYSWWMAFIKDHYQPVTLPGSTGTILWQLRRD